MTIHKKNLSGSWFVAEEACNKSLRILRSGVCAKWSIRILYGGLSVQVGYLAGCGDRIVKMAIDKN